MSLSERGQVQRVNDFLRWNPQVEFSADEEARFLYVAAMKEQGLRGNVKRSLGVTDLRSLRPRRRRQREQTAGKGREEGNRRRKVNGRTKVPREGQR